MVGDRYGGRIVSFSLVFGFIETCVQVNYSAPKADTVHAIRALAIKIASRDDIVNSVASGVIETQMGKNLPIDEAVRMNPMCRYVRTDERTAAVAGPCSYETNFVSRRVMAVSDGTI